MNSDAETEVQAMKTEVGVWIDRRQAIIVTLVAGGEEVRRVTSGLEKHVRYSGPSHGSHDETTEIRRDRQDRRRDDYLSKYYDEVIACLGDAESILILGPGEAKSELQKQLEGRDLSERISGLETADSMTDDQVVAQVRQYFQG